MNAKRGPGTRLSRLIAWAIPLCVAGTAQATTPALTSIRSATAVAGKFLFSLPDGALVVLDATTGNQLFRGQAREGESYGQDSFIETPHGVVTRTYRHRDGRRTE